MMSVVLFIVWISNIIYSGDRNFWNKNSIDNQEKKWNNEWRLLPIQERLSHALVEGIDKFFVEDTEDARIQLDRPI